MSKIYFDNNKMTYEEKETILKFGLTCICEIESALWQDFCQDAPNTSWDIVNSEFVDLRESEEFKEMQALKERERINLLNMTKADFWIALLDKNIAKEDVLEKINLIKTDIQRAKAKIQLEEANNYWRGNEFIDLIGNMFGITSNELDFLFENKSF